MNETLEYIADKFDVDLTLRSPIQVGGTNRKMWAETWRELGFTVGAEVGVADGRHSETLCSCNPGLHLFAVDPWEPYAGYVDYTPARLDQFYRGAVERLRPYDVTVVRKRSMDAVGDFADGSLDFVYIDGAHDFKSVAEDACDWSRKVRVGGVVYGHDYYWRTDKPTNVIHVRHVVAAYTYSHHVKPWFVLDAWRDRSDPALTDRVQSWMFVRQETDRL